MFIYLLNFIIKILLGTMLSSNNILRIKTYLHTKSKDGDRV